MHGAAAHSYGLGVCTVSSCSSNDKTLLHLPPLVASQVLLHLAQVQGLLSGCIGATVALTKCCIQAAPVATG